jgi:hypothetical protein
MIGNKFDVRVYCQQSLVDALYHLSSIQFALIRPVLKITVRSLLAQPEPSSHERLLLLLEYHYQFSSEFLLVFFIFLKLFQMMLLPYLMLVLIYIQ